MERKSPKNELYKSFQGDIPELYKTLCSRFGEDNPFAKYNMGIGTYIWSDNRYPWIRKTEADAIDRPLIEDALEQTKARVADVVGPVSAEKILNIPDESYIYYHIDESGKARILITGWGFKKPVGGDGGGEKAPISTKHPVAVSFSYDGEKLPNYAFGIKLEKQVRVLCTNSQGLYPFPDLKVGTHYTLIDKKSGKEYALQIVEGRSTYDFDVTCHTALRLSATCDGRPLDNEVITIHYHGRCYEVSTDNFGQATVQLSLYEGDTASATLRGETKSIIVQADGNRIAFAFESPEEPTDPIPEPSIEEPQPFVEEPKSTTSFDPYILVCRADGSCVTNYPIEVTYRGTVTHYTTDPRGRIELTGSEEGEQLCITDGNNSDHTVAYELHAEQREYRLQLPDENQICVMFHDMNEHPISCDDVVFQQKGHPDLVAKLDEEGAVRFAENTFQTGEQLTVSIRGWNADKAYQPIPFVIDEGENLYLLQERAEYYTSSWKTRLLELLALLVAIVALVWLWPGVEWMCAALNEWIY